MSDNTTQQGANAEQSQGDPGAAPSGIAEPERRDGDKRLVLVGTHLLVAMLVLSMWAAADTWQAVTGFALAGLLSVLTAFLAGGTRRSRRRVLVTQIGADDDRLRRLREA